MWKWCSTFSRTWLFLCREHGCLGSCHQFLSSTQPDSKKIPNMSPIIRLGRRYISNVQLITLQTKGKTFPIIRLFHGLQRINFHFTVYPFLSLWETICIVLICRALPCWESLGIRKHFLRISSTPFLSKANCNILYYHPGGREAAFLLWQKISSSSEDICWDRSMSFSKKEIWSAEDTWILSRSMARSN